MGKYGAHVWASYAFSLAVIAALALQALRRRSRARDRAAGDGP